MQGFKIIQVKNGVLKQVTYDTGEVDYQPVTKYDVDKVNAFDTTMIKQRKPYHDDTIECKVILNSNEYLGLLDLLRNGEKKYIEFMHDNTLIQLPVTVSKEPKDPNDHRFYAEKISFTLNAKYKQHSLINFDYAFGYGENFGNNFGY
jgi:hypothetical protein